MISGDSPLVIKNSFHFGDIHLIQVTPGTQTIHIDKLTHERKHLEIVYFSVVNLPFSGDAASVTECRMT